ncbi:Acetamidase [Lachnellula suecica]|uniref:amidase n=1 Tax=Lachnellula suecica TaxID=602035 RepID=A0A8T9BVG9_9HELO|nr:Acetamidase [Lachnellula suecica]
MSPTTQEPWEIKVAHKQAQVKAAIPSEWLLPSTLTPSSNVLGVPHESGILSNKELEITESYTAKQLLESLAAGTLTSAEVTAAFSKRAAIAQQLTSCVTEPLFEQAKERAKFLDDYLAKEKKVFGPLHGLPVSLKDGFKVKGVQSTIGYVSFLDHEPDTTNSVLVNMLLDLGAVLHVKTNIPQTLMTADSHNNIFGRTLNPYNTQLTAGGSSGGEGALIALRGSILGVGTDIAGSIRIPSLCCGTYGFKPTSGRIPFGGMTSPGLIGTPGLVPCAGPLATTFSDLKLFVSTILKAKPWLLDSTAHAVPWRSTHELSGKTTLTIGVLAEDPIFPYHPPVRRTLNNAIAALQAAAPLGSNNQSRGGQSNRHGDLQDRSGKDVHQPHHLQRRAFVPSVAAAVAITSTGPAPKVYGVLDIAAMNRDMHAYREAWREMFRSEKLDVVLGPGAQCTAVPHDSFGIAPYTVMWNLLDVSIPLEKVVVADM